MYSVKLWAKKLETDLVKTERGLIQYSVSVYVRRCILVPQNQCVYCTQICFKIARKYLKNARG